MPDDERIEWSSIGVPTDALDRLNTFRRRVEVETDSDLSNWALILALTEYVDVEEFATFVAETDTDTEVVDE